MIMDPRRSVSTLVVPVMFVTSSGKAYAADTCPRRFGDAGGSPGELGVPLTGIPLWDAGGSPGELGVPLTGIPLSRGSHSLRARGEPTCQSAIARAWLTSVLTLRALLPDIASIPLFRGMVALSRSFGARTC
jgi:hypothetical protein